MSVSRIPEAAKHFWRRFEFETRICGTERFCGAGHFDDNESSANALAHLWFGRARRELQQDMCARIGRQAERSMPVVCEHFEVVYRDRDVAG